jgi:hypothetical protein
MCMLELCRHPSGVLYCAAGEEFAHRLVHNLQATPAKIEVFMLTVENVKGCLHRVRSLGASCAMELYPGTVLPNRRKRAGNI